MTLFTAQAGAAARRRPPSGRLSQMRRREELAGYLFLLPNFLGVCLLVMLPIFSSLILGFTEWNPAQGLGAIKFTGLENFEKMLADGRVWTSLLNNLVYTLAYVPLCIGIALVLAALLNHYVFMRVPLRLMIFMPYISSVVSVAVVWMVLLYPEGGPVNAILTNVFGIANPPKWFVSTDWALIGIIMMSVWHDVGYYTIILLAGMQDIPAEIYEAANIDGAGTLQKFFRITVPMLSPTIFFTSILATIRSFQVFDQINIITRGGPGRATFVLVYCIYYYAFEELNFSYASAIALLLFAIIFILSLIQLKLREKFTY